MYHEIKDMKLVDIKLDRGWKKTIQIPFTLFSHLLMLHINYTGNFEIEYDIQLLMTFDDSLWFHTH